ncbi:MAG: transposase [Bdellovibrionota bacterium]
MQQSLYFKSKNRKEHGGNLSLRRRKTKRPLTTRNPFHVTLRSELATGKRSLLRHKNMIYKVLHKASRRFGVRIYQQAICGNHIHLLVRGRQRFALQNFFRVVAGHIAQKILELYPIPAHQHNAGNAPKMKYRRKFWGALLYSRMVRWGRDYSNVVNYIERNVLEAIGWIPYVRKKWRYFKKGGAMPPPLHVRI